MSWGICDSEDGEFDGERYVDFSDFFCWGCADGEQIKEGDMEAIEACQAECALHGVTGEEANEFGALLWAARKIKLRPQGAAYSYIPWPLWHLFHAAAPERSLEDYSNHGLPGHYERGPYSLRNKDGTLSTLEEKLNNA